MKTFAESANPEKYRLNVPLVSAAFDDGTLVETVFDPAKRQTSFVIWDGKTWRLDTSFVRYKGKRFVPYSPDNNLLKNEVVLLPSEPAEYGSQAELVNEIQSFIRRYVDVSPLFESMTSYYVLLSWIYDSFNELPYLRLRGDPGCGKTRFLLTVGSLCYKPIFASGASSVSPLFRILDAFRGTLIIDEGDFRMSDERAEIVKILNNGNAKGFPVLRSEVSGKREFNPTAYSVFGPKLVATRGFFEDRALESRCLTEEMGQQRLRDDVPINLPSSYKNEALELRNKLLLFRLRTRRVLETPERLVDRSIEPRLNQVFVPLLSIVEDDAARETIRELARSYHREMVADRGMDSEARILEVIRDLAASGAGKLSVKDITSWFIDRYGEEYERRVTTKWVGNILRKRLHLKTQKSHGNFVIPLTEQPKLPRLYDRYGISTREAEDVNSSVAKEPGERVDLGDNGDISR